MSDPNDLQPEAYGRKPNPIPASKPVPVPAELVEALREALADGPDYTPTRLAARALVDAVERPPEDEQMHDHDEPMPEAPLLDVIAPAAPPSEPLCRCGHTSIWHPNNEPCAWTTYKADYPAPGVPCDCEKFSLPPSISDEAERPTATEAAPGQVMEALLTMRDRQDAARDAPPSEAEAPSGWWMVSPVSETDGWIEVWDDSDDRGPRALFRDAGDAEFVVAAVRAACQEEA